MVESMEGRQLLAATFGQIAIGDGFTPPMAIANGPDGKLWVTIPATFQEYESENGSFLTSPAAIGSVDPATGAVEVIPTPTAAATLSSIVAGPGGFLWFTETPDPVPGGKSAIAAYDPASGRFGEFPVAGLAPIGLAVGTGGDLWFTGYGAVGVFNAYTHASTVFPLPEVGGQTDYVNAIVAGPDGKMWFTVGSEVGAGVDAIGSIDPTTHAIVLTPTNDGDAPTSIALGPDDALWFTESISGVVDGRPAFDSTPGIGRIDPATRNITDIRVSTSQDDAAFGITTGPDGRLWFTGNGSVGSVDPTTHAVTENAYAPGGLVDDSPGIADGPDGNLWFTDALGVGVATPLAPATAAVTGFAYTDALGPSIDWTAKGGLSVYLDLDGDGVPGPGEPTAVTDAYGYYAFTGLPAGTYIARLAPAPGLVATQPPGGATVTAALGSAAVAAPLRSISQSSILPLAYDPAPFGSNEPDLATAEAVGLYRIVLGRAPDAPGLAAAVAFLKEGVGSYGALAGLFLRSDEYLTRLVSADYRTFLGREGTPADVASWVAALRPGGTAEGMASAALDSAEFDAAHPDDASFLGAVYRDVLGRSGSAAEIAAWEDLINKGMSRSQVVAHALSSDEARQRVITGLDDLILEVAGSPLPIPGWLRSGAGAADLVADYFDLTQVAELAGDFVG